MTQLLAPLPTASHRGATKKSRNPNTTHKAVLPAQFRPATASPLVFDNSITPPITMTITNGTTPTSSSGTTAPVKTSALASVTPTSITLDANTVSSMLEVRAAIDALDVQIVTLLGTRLRFIEAASRIKPVKEAVRDEPRKRDVLDKAMATAEKVNFPPKLMEDIYEVLVEGCINYEGVKFDEREAAKENGEQS